MNGAGVTTDFGGFQVAHHIDGACFTFDFDFSARGYADHEIDAIFLAPIAHGDVYFAAFGYCQNVSLIDCCAGRSGFD
jgi:hypothetical protein